MKKILLGALCGAFVALAQDAMSLKDAVRLALAGNKSIEAADAVRKAAGSRVTEAQSGRLPKVNYSESWTRSDNPVFVFSSLLTQHRFGEANFEIGPLNRPDFLNDFQSQLTADQPIYDAGQTKHAVRAASLGQELVGEDGRRRRMSVIADVVRSYYDALLSAEEVGAATQSMRSAEADLKRAEDVHTAGMSTDADVLSIRVHISAIYEEQIRRGADLDVARATLNDALSLPLDTQHTLTTALTPMKIPDAVLMKGYETGALNDRPEAREATTAVKLAENRVGAARSGYLPQVDLHMAFEADRQRFYDRGGDNWLVSIGLRWNLFNGGADRARTEEGTFALRQREAEKQRADSAIQLQVHRAWADLRAAQQRIEVTEASVAEAEESLRITQNRYESGLGNVTDLLRTETVVLDAKTRRLAAIHDQRIAAVALELAAGTLSLDSAALNQELQ